MGQSYDHPDYTVRKRYHASSVGSASATEYAPFVVFAASRLKNVGAVVTSTATAARKLHVLVNGCVVASGTISTKASGCTISIGSIDRDLAAFDRVGALYDVGAEGLAHIVFEYIDLPA